MQRTDMWSRWKARHQRRLHPAQAQGGAREWQKRRPSQENDSEVTRQSEVVLRFLAIALGTGWFVWMARGVLKKELTGHLRSKRRIGRSRHSRVGGQSRGQIVEAISMRERPAEIEDQAIPGQWEGDL